VFDFNVNREAETLLINGYALKLIPQRVRKLPLPAAVIPADQPGTPREDGAIMSPEAVAALQKLEQNGLVTADVDLAIAYANDVREITILVRVVEVEGKLVIHKDLLHARITLPPLPGRTAHVTGTHHNLAGLGHAPMESCSPSDWKCRVNNWLNALQKMSRGSCHRPAGEHGAGHGPDGPEWDRRPEWAGHDRRPGQYHRHRFHRPHHGFMRFIISVVVPVLIGAAVGVGIGILSVFIAEIAGGVIARIRGRRATEYVEVDGKSDDCDDYCAMEGDELPQYVELPQAPAYMEEKR
jgi:hypothetical protein